MATGFPLNPANNQIYTNVGGISYIYNSTKKVWRINTSASQTVTSSAITDATVAGKNILTATNSNAQMQLIIQSLPTTLPAQAGIAWNDGGYVAIS